MRINGIDLKVAPKTVHSVNGGVHYDFNGVRQIDYDRWGMSWNGNHFAPPVSSSALYLPGVPGQGATIIDYSGNGNDGTITGATWRQLPSGLWYLDFDALDDNVNCGSDSSVDNNFDGGGTTSAWINVRSDGELDVGRIIGKYTVNNGWVFFVKDESGGAVKLSFYIEAVDFDGNWETTDREITLNTWTKVVATYDADLITNDPAFFVNGLSKAVTEISNPVGARTSDVGVNLRVGDTDDGNTSFDGGIALPKLNSETVSTPLLLADYNRERHLFGV